jgi:hypothetical protein
LQTYYRVLIAAVILTLSIYVVFVSGPIMSCIWGFIIALTLFWIRETHQRLYGLSEIAAGLFVLHEVFPKGRGGFSSGFFAEAIETFHGNVVLISTLGAVYIMVRGLDNIWNPRRR